MRHLSENNQEWISFLKLNLAPLYEIAQKKMETLDENTEAETLKFVLWSMTKSEKKNNRLRLENYEYEEIGLTREHQKYYDIANWMKENVIEFFEVPLDGILLTYTKSVSNIKIIENKRIYRIYINRDEIDEIINEKITIR